MLSLLLLPNKDMRNIKEIWKDVQGYEGFYKISNYGRVKALERSTPTKMISLEIILKPSETDLGYQYVSLKGKNHSIHRLVGKHFIRNPKNKPCINHWDANPKNNHVSNLEWCTHSENSKHPYLNLGRVNKLKGRLGKNCNVTKNIIIQYSLAGRKLNEFYGVCEASRQTGIDFSDIAKASKVGKQAKGFIWKRRKIKKK